MKEKRILKALDNNRIFYIQKIKYGFRFVEGCDSYFEMDLTKEDVLTLSEELKELANEE